MVRYRAARTADHGPLAELLRECRRAAFHWRPPESFSLEDFGRETAGERIVVAERSSRIVGFVSVWVPERFIHHLYVSPREQGQGIGTGLVSSLFDDLPLPYRLKCQQQNVRALQHYRSRGWRECGAGCGADGDYLVLELGRGQ